MWYSIVYLHPNYPEIPRITQVFGSVEDASKEFFRMTELNYKVLLFCNSKDLIEDINKIKRDKYE